MSKLNRTFMIMFVLTQTVLVNAQTEKKQERPADTQQSAAVEQSKSASPVLKDLDADGVDDRQVRTRNSSRQSGRTRDTFIDANGDGICDAREQGLGFRRGNGAAAPQTGKRQQGRQK